MSVKFSFAIDNTAGLNAVHDTLLHDLNAAAAEWSRGLVGDGTITVAVHEGTEGKVVGNANFIDTGATDVYGQEAFAPLAVLDANSNGTYDSHPPNTPDINMTVDPTALTTAADPVSLMAHGLGHGLGIDGFYDFDTNNYDVGAESTYDAQVLFLNGDEGLAFLGSHAGFVPLADNDPYHVVTTSPDIMNEEVPSTTAGPTDFQILADIGYHIDLLNLPSG